MTSQAARSVPAPPLDAAHIGGPLDRIGRLAW